METLTNYIYLLQEREFVNINSNIFKVGMTTKLNHERFNQYPKGSKLLFQIICNDCKNIEKIILKKFKEKFNQQLAIGNEYFEGDYKIMIDDIYSIVKNNNEEEHLKIKQLEEEFKQKYIEKENELIKIVKQELPLKIKYKLRNNQWRKHKNVLDSIIYTKKIVSPYGHWKETNKLFDEGKFNNEKFAKIFINDININDYILMFDTNYDYALVLKITSKPIAERINDIIIIRDNKCNHTPLVKDCKECIDSILEIFSSKYFEENYKSYTKYLNEDYKFENMHAIIRNVEIVGKINNTCEAFNQKNYFQGSINRINIEIDRKDILKVNIDNEQLNIDNKKDYETDSDDDNNNIIL